MNKAHMDAAIGLLKLRGVPILYAHENGAWWINTHNSEIINKIKVPTDAALELLKLKTVPNGHINENRVWGVEYQPPKINEEKEDSLVCKGAQNEKLTIDDWELL